jgi:outer membrane lipopolysaccharide assembly protein LptE/RlpB
MIKFLKIYLILLLIILITGCSYKPILSKQNYDFIIEKVELNGDKEVNSVIIERLTNSGLYYLEDRYTESVEELEKQLNLKKQFNLKKQNNKNQYYVQIETSKVKNIISNDSKGDPSKLEIIISSTFQISNSEELLIKRKVKMKKTYNNISDKLKLEKYESFIINDLSERISDNLISTIININDN